MLETKNTRKIRTLISIIVVKMIIIITIIIMTMIMIRRK